MNTNYTQAKSWILSAISDIGIVFNALKQKYFSLVAFKSQFATEKLNKALLNLLGLKIEKTHTPSEILKEFIANENVLVIDEQAKEIILNILNCSFFFESQGTKTRYGLIQNNKLIIAEEIYSKFEDVKEFIVNLVKIVNYHIILLDKTFNITEKNFLELKQLKKFVKKLEKWT